MLALGRDAMTSHPFAQGETGNRIVCFGQFLWVTGDGHRGISHSGVSRSAVQPSAAGSRFPRPMAEMPTPDLPPPVAVTRHLEVSVCSIEYRGSDGLR